MRASRDPGGEGAGEVQVCALVRPAPATGRGLVLIPEVDAVRVRQSLAVDAGHATGHLGHGVHFEQLAHEAFRGHAESLRLGEVCAADEHPLDDIAGLDLDFVVPDRQHSGEGAGVTEVYAVE